jgi:hypothetical protein
MKIRKFAFPLIAGMMLLMSASMFADTFFGAPTAVSGLVPGSANDPLQNASHWLGQEFQLTAGGTLTSVMIGLNNFTAGDQVEAWLCNSGCFDSDSGTRINLGGHVGTGLESTVTFNGTWNINTSAGNTDWFLVVTAPESSTGNPYWAESNGITVGVPGQGNFNNCTANPGNVCEVWQANGTFTQAQIDDPFKNSVPWTDIGSGPGGNTGPNNKPLQFQLTFQSATTPVPEPGSLMLLGTGIVAGIGGMRRRFFN